MKRSALQFLAAPTFDDEEKTRIAFLLNTILITFLIGDISYLVFSLLAALGQTPSANYLNILLLGGIVVVWLVGLLVLLRWGHVRTAAISFVVSWWCIVSLSYIGLGTVKTSGLSAYIVVVIIAALLLGGRAALALGFISVVTESALFYAEQVGLISSFGNNQLDTVTVWVIASLYIILASVFLYLAASSISKASARARQHERALAERNQDLEREIALHSQTEEAYRLLVEQMSQGLFIFQDNHIVFANKAVADQTGRTLAELLSLENPYELIYPDDRALVAQNLQNQTSGETAPQHYDFRLMEKAGQIRWIEIFALPIKYRGKAAIQALTVDVTERRQHEKTLRDSEEIARQFQEKLKALHELSIVLTKANSLDDLCRLVIVSGCNHLEFDRLGLWMIEEETGEVAAIYGIDEQGALRFDGNVEYRLKSDPRIIELLSDKASVKVWEDVALFNHQHQPVGHGWNAIALLWNGDEVIGGIAADNLLKQKPLLPYQSELLGLYGTTVGHLITRKRTEEQLRHSEERFAKAFQASPVPIAICTVNDLSYVNVNDSWVKLFGYSRDEAIGRTGAELNIWVDKGEYTRLSTALNEQSWLPDQDIMVRTKNGDVLYALWSAVEITLQQGTFMLSMTYDITERKQAELQRLELALTNERLQFLTEFLGNMSHDLKTPLAVIKTSLYLLEQLRDPEKQKGQLRKINEQTQSLERYIQDILTISRLDHTESLINDSVAAVNLNTLIQRVEDELRPSAEKKNLRTVLNLDINMPTVLGDEDELYRAMINLVENAFNYTPEGGMVAIDTFKDEYHAVAKVSDTGIGISEAELPHIFDRFYRSEQAKADVKSGSGLGLAIVKRVIDLHRGTIEVESIPGKGTTFAVRLPVGK
jgi:PAS domain S-box-containing protein